MIVIVSPTGHVNIAFENGKISRDSLYASIIINFDSMGIYGFI